MQRTQRKKCSFQKERKRTQRRQRSFSKKRKKIYFDPQVSNQVKCPKLMSIVNLEDLNHHINYHGSLSLMTKESKTSNLVKSRMEN